MYPIDSNSIFDVFMKGLLPFFLTVGSIVSLILIFIAYRKYCSLGMYEGKLNFRIVLCQFVFIFAFGLHFFYYDSSKPYSPENFILPTFPLEPNSLLAAILAIPRGFSVAAYVLYNIGFLHHFQKSLMDMLKEKAGTVPADDPIHKNSNFMRRLKYGYDPLALVPSAFVVLFAVLDKKSMGLKFDGLASIYDSFIIDVLSVISTLFTIPFFVFTYLKLQKKLLSLEKSVVKDMEDPEQACQIKSIIKLYDRTKWNIIIFSVVMIPLLMLRSVQALSPENSGFSIALRTFVYILHSSGGILQLVSHRNLKEKDEMLYRNIETDITREIEGTSMANLEQATNINYDMPLLFKHSSERLTRQASSSINWNRRNSRARSHDESSNSNQYEAHPRELFEIILMCGQLCLQKEGDILSGVTSTQDASWEQQTSGPPKCFSGDCTDFVKYKTTLRDLRQLFHPTGGLQRSSLPNTESGDQPVELTCIIYAKKLINCIRQSLNITRERLQQALHIEDNLLRFNPIGSMLKADLQSFVLHDGRFVLDQVTIEKRRMLLNEAAVYYGRVSTAGPAAEIETYLQPILGVFSIQKSANELMNLVLYENPFNYAMNYEIRVIIRADHITMFDVLSDELNTISERNINQGELEKLTQLISNMRNKGSILRALKNDIKFLMSRKQWGYAVFLLLDARGGNNNKILIAYHASNFTFGSFEQGLNITKPPSLIEGMKDPAMYGSLMQDKLVDLFQ